jgi:hypothetical protein
MAWDMQTYGLRPVAPQITPATFRTRFFWSSRLASDPASKWIREIVLTTYAELHSEADRLVERALLEPAKGTSQTGTSAE